jgi:hypothetical protein
MIGKYLSGFFKIADARSTGVIADSISKIVSKYFQHQTLRLSFVEDPWGEFESDIFSIQMTSHENDFRTAKSRVVDNSTI